MWVTRANKMIKTEFSAVHIIHFNDQSTAAAA